MRRRDILAGAGLAASGAAASFPSPAITQEIRQLKLVTDWPEETPGNHASAVRFAQTIGAATGGRIKIEVFPAGALVRPFETFDAVGAGVADMYHSFEDYFEQKSRALHFFGAIPFGFTADELFAWIQYGGGAIVVTLPVGEIMPALKSGAIDASEWVGPWPDMAMGLHKVASYYYYPGFHEPGTGLAVGINKDVWESFDASDRRVIEAVAACEYARSLAEFNANNALSLRKLRDEGAIKILKFDDSLLKVMLAISKDVVAEIGSNDELSRKIYASYQQFRASIMDWTDISERAYLNSRSLA
jgi:TRAP-type mannitol/chloroaromatic compound transport system substrate-binding protein